MDAIPAGRSGVRGPEVRLAAIPSWKRPLVRLVSAGLLGALLLSAPGASAACAPSTDQIVRMGTSAWMVERSLLAWYAQRPARIDDVVRVRRERGPDGKVIGYKLMGIRCGSPAHLAGLRNGDVLRAVNGRRSPRAAPPGTRDVLRAVNGRAVRSFAEALLTYVRVRGEQVIELDVLRSTGETERLLYRIL